MVGESSIRGHADVIALLVFVWTTMSNAICLVRRQLAVTLGLDAFPAGIARGFLTNTMEFVNQNYINQITLRSTEQPQNVARNTFPVRRLVPKIVKIHTNVLLAMNCT